MADDAKKERLWQLSRLPAFAQVDHRLIGPEPLKSLNRAERRTLRKRTDGMLRRYYAAWRKERDSGAGYPVDQLLRQFMGEYNNRYLSSGTHTQPISFRYIEPFVDITLFEGVAPFTGLRREKDHLFDLQDFLDFATSKDVPTQRLSELLGKIEEGVVHHYSCIGDVLEFTILAPSGRPFAVSGFSLVRHGTHVHWYVLGGELFDDDEWSEMAKDVVEMNIEAVHAAKKPLVNKLYEEKAGLLNPPIPLEGTEKSLRTVLTGEMDLGTERHVNRCYMAEREHSFEVISDDPETFVLDCSEQRRLEIVAASVQRIERAGALWNLAECLLKLPAYFNFKFSMVRAAPAVETARLSGGHAGTSGREYSRYKTVSALEVLSPERLVVRRYTAPSYAVEIYGHWRQLSAGALGTGPNGEKVTGKTWVKSHNRWRERPPRPREILLKSSVAAARLRVEGSGDSTGVTEEAGEPSSGDAGELYVMRCPVMDGEIYKIGWTTKGAAKRAGELSSQTGVPMSYIVVEAWAHENAKALERAVHVQLSRYRINKRREFFKAPFETVRRVVVQEAERLEAACPKRTDG